MGYLYHYARILNPFKCAYFDRLQAAVILIKGLYNYILSKYAKLIILFASNKRRRGVVPICLNAV